MGTIRNLAEPTVIALLFTLGTLINRHRGRQNVTLSEAITDASRGSSRSSRIVSPDRPQRSWLPDNTVFRDNLLSRFLAAFPFLMEIWYWNLTYWVYQLARALSAHLIRHSPTITASAQSHAALLLRIENALGIAIERPIQQYILNHHPNLMPLLARIYYSHITLGVAFLVYMYTYTPLSTYRRIRRTIAMDNLIAFVVMTAWRCAPPRLMPERYGFVDVLHPHKKNAPQDWNNNSFQLTLAAMPSLHFGTSLLLAFTTVSFSRHKALRVIAPFWPAAMFLTILATANHWVLDAVVGACIPLLGWNWNRVFASRPFEFLEQWGFWVCRTEKPIPVKEQELGEEAPLLPKGEERHA